VGSLRLDEPTPSDVRQFAKEIKENALRCLYNKAEDDGLIDHTGNPASKVGKPRRLPSTRRAIADTQLAEINQVAAATGDDPGLDALILRLHTETACRRGGALMLRPLDLDPEQCRSCSGKRARRSAGSRSPPPLWPH
jgi:hypothetical protein